MGIHKQFDQNIYNGSDPVKFAVALKLNQLGYYTMVVEDFGADVKTFNKEKGYEEHEVEQRPIWKDGKFPFNTIHIPERKTRLLNDNNLYYWVVNADATMAMVCKAKECMVKECLEVVPNNLVADKEEFYNVPIEKFKLVRLE